jgi:Glycosyltransferase family 87
MSEADAKTGPRAAALATIATTSASAAVALLASRPDSPLTPPLAPGAEAPGILSRAAEALLLDRLSRDAAAALSAVLIFAAVAAFLFALRVAWRGDLGVGRVLIVGLLLHVLSLATPLFLSRDVYSYGIYGRMVSEYGANPFVTTPLAFPQDPVFPLVSEDWRDSPSVYGPAFVAISAGITTVAASPGSMVWAFKVVAALAGIGTMFLVAGAARRVRPQRAAFAAALIAWNPVVLFHGVAGGHNDALVGLTIAGAVLLLVSRRQLAATAVLVLGSLVKLTGVIPLLVAVSAAVLRRPKGRRSRALGAHAGIAAVVAVPFIAPFFQTRDPTLGTLELSTRRGWLAPSAFAWKLLRGAGRVLGVPEVGTVLGVLALIAFPVILGAVLVGLFRHLARDPGRITPEITVATMGWAMLIALMAAPLLLPWYAVAVMPFAWLLPRAARGGAIILAALLAITELVADPTSSPKLWEAMVIGLHWVASPLVLVLLVRLVLDLRRRLALGPSDGSMDPLLLEELGPVSVRPESGTRRGRVAGGGDQKGRRDAARSSRGDAERVRGDRAEDETRQPH